MRRRTILGLVGLLLLSTPPASAGTGSTTLVVTEAPEVEVLNQRTWATTTVDLDGDGLRDIVAVVESDDAGRHDLVTGWLATADGSLIPLVPAPLQTPGLPIGSGRLKPVVGEAWGTFWVAHEGAHEVLLLGTGLWSEASAIWQAVLVGDRLTLRQLYLGPPFVWASVLDLDGDGTDEVILAAANAQQEMSGTLEAYRLAGSTLEFLASVDVADPAGAADPGSPINGYAINLGDTDGLPGEEFGWATYQETPGQTTWAFRFALRDGALIQEWAEVPPNTSLLADSQWGPLYGQTDELIWFADWPAGAREPLELATLAVLPSMAMQPTFLGDGPGAWLLALTWDLRQTLHVIDIGANDRTIEAGVGSGDPLPEDFAPGWNFVRAARSDEPDGFYFSGALLTVGGAGRLVVERAPGTADRSLVGLVGLGAARFVIHVSARYDEPTNTVKPGGVQVVPTLRPTESGLLAAGLVGATELADGTWATDGTSPAVDIDAPAGSRVVCSLTGPDFGPGQLECDETIDGPYRLELPRPAGMLVDRYAYWVRIWIVTPGGVAHQARWQIRPFIKAVELEAEAGPPAGLGVPLTGATQPFNTVTVNGQPVDVAEDGTFTAVVDLPPWPSSVRLVATDPIGQTKAIAVTAVGLYDYRGLPWVPILLAVTAVAGLVMWLRAPRRRPPQSDRNDDGGSTFEEIG